MAEQQPCPREAELQALIDGGLPEKRQASIATHLESCEDCRRRLESLSNAASLIVPGDASAAESAKGSEALAEAIRKLKGTAADLDATVAGSGMGPPSLRFLSPSEDPRHLGRLGGYEILEVIGRGGMGTVLKARDSKLERLVAIKVLNPDLASSGPARLRFLREARSAAAVTHEHVVTIHAVDDLGDSPFLVMEYIVGVSLEDRIQRSGHLKVEEVLRIGMQAAGGLAAAHAQGLVHRDIKPSNILLENGVERVKITDFGLARVVHEAQLTQTNAVAGTPQYMSPEQASGKPVDHRSDLFSLGCVMYAMCVGRSPFRADTPIGAIHRVCEDTPRPIRDVNPEIPDWLVAIIDRLLEKEPEERFQTAGEVAEVLGQHLAHVQQPSRVALPKPLLRAAPVGSYLPKSLSRTQVGWLGGLACLLLLIAGSAWIWNARRPKASSPERGNRVVAPPLMSGRVIDNAGVHFLLLDLQGVANYDLNQATDQSANDLSDLAPGMQFLSGTPFQFGEKYIRLRGMYLDACPDRIRDISVETKVDRLYFLHGAQYAGEVGTRICQYEIQYEDKSTEVVPVLTGVDVWDWYEEPQHPEQGELVWIGTNPQSITKNKTIQLFRSTWINPRPDMKISRIGISKAPNVNTSPFCVAITAEFAQEDASSGEDGRLHVCLD